jgi:hypothetical protein
MANNDQLKHGSALASTTVLTTLGDSPVLVFVFGPLFHPPPKDSAHLACRNLVVWFGFVTNDRFVPQVSRDKEYSHSSLA